MEFITFQTNGYRGFLRSGYEWLASYIKSLDDYFSSPHIKIIKRTPDRYNALLDCEEGQRKYKFYIKYDDFIKGKSHAKILRYLFKKSRAMNSWEVAVRMIDAGIPTSEPIAVGERRKYGFLMQSFYITQFIDGAMNIYDYYLKKRNDSLEFMSWRRKIIDELSFLIGKMHLSGIVHGDLKRNNILIKDDLREGHQLFFVDIESARVSKEVSEKGRIRDLGRLYRSLEDIVSGYEVMRFMKGYFESAKIERSKREEIVAKVRNF